jgi:dihydrofolate reductase
MVLKRSVFIATSLDGYIAGRDGSIDWLASPASQVAADDCGHNSYMQTIDTVVIGRDTHQKVLSFGSWPYGRRKVVVLSSEYPRQISSISENTAGASSKPEELLNILEASGSLRVCVDGGKTIQSFLRRRLIQEMTITRLPILIGDGLPLFGALDCDLN